MLDAEQGHALVTHPLKIKCIMFGGKVSKKADG
jgi:hypothetical protein